MYIDKPRIIELPKIQDPRGNLTFIQYQDHLPFEIKRVFWIYDVPGGETRGGHAYKSQQEIIVSLSGSFDVVVTNREGEKIKYSLNRSWYGLYLPPLTWRHIENFSTNSLGLHLSSSDFTETDYVRKFDEFINLSL
jgi:oxalate decarboxylase/phosphoglucose isomerase-like protein (cupin superfamily)